MEVADPEDLVVPEPGVPDELVQPVEPVVVPEHEPSKHPHGMGIPSILME